MSEHCRKACGLCGEGARAASAEEATCNDSHEHCGRWAAVGQCAANEQYMRETCPKACGVCTVTPPCSDEDGHERCEYWARNGYCDSNAQYMSERCRRSCKLCDAAAECADVPLLDCAGWAKEAQCVRNRRFMAKMCVATCGWCGAPDVEQAGKASCADEDIKCADWAEKGECLGRTWCTPTPCTFPSARC